MKPLNPGKIKVPAGLPIGDLYVDRVRVFRFGGKRIAFDPDTLAVHELAADEAPPAKSLEVPQHPPGGTPRPSAICLALTRGCNLACDYCYVRGRGAPAETMSRETIARAFDLFGKPRRYLRVSFFGGEPLTAWSRLRWGVERGTALARATGSRVRFHVTTNGTLLSSERLAFLARYGFSMIFSIDGPPDLHDAHRKFEGGCGSYSRVAGALDMLADYPELAARTTLRATFLPGEAEMVRRLEHLNDLADRYALGAVSVEPAVGCGACADAGGFRPGEIARAIVAGARWCAARARNDDVDQVRFHFLSVTLRRLLERRPAGTECGAAFGYASVAPNGEVFACHKESHGPVGHVRTGLDEAARAKWRENRWYGAVKCRRCWARNLCGGGCRAEMEGPFFLRSPAATSCAKGKGRAVAALATLAELAGDHPALRRICPPPGGAKCDRTRA